MKPIIRTALVAAVVVLGRQALAMSPAPPPYEEVWPSRRPPMDVRQALATAIEALRPAGTNFYCMETKLQAAWTGTNGQYAVQWWLQFGSTTNNHLYQVRVDCGGTATVDEIAPNAPPERYYHWTNTNFWNKVNTRRRNRGTGF